MNGYLLCDPLNNGCGHIKTNIYRPPAPVKCRCGKDYKHKEYSPNVLNETLIGLGGIGNTCVIEEMD